VINYKQLHYFWSVAKYGGITRAAEQLFLTPQTISGQLSELEQSMGAPLFQRQGKRLVLTSAGQLAYSHADEIFQIGRELEALLKGYQEESDLPFRVGVSDVIPKSIAYRLLAPAMKLPEPIKILCIESKPDLLLADLALHKIDLVVSDRPLPSEIGIKGFSHFLGESPLAFYATPNVIQQMTGSFPQSLNGMPLLLPGKDCAMRVSLERWLTKHKLQPHVKGEFDDTALMKAFGEEGLGVFPGPEIMAAEVERQHGAQVIGVSTDILCRYYAISVQRKLSHPAVVAISESARTTFI
jgi:LysR family transcriptional regulator, transcriptional activator of nhaA